MTRDIVLYCFTIAAAFASLARAEVTFQTEGGNDIRVVRMTVTPAAEPVPALRHRLMPRDIDLKAGNAVPYYYRALLNMPATMERVRKEFGDDFDTWYITGPDATAIEKLPLDKVRKAVEMSTGGVIGQQLADAVSRRDCNWELNVGQIQGPDIISFMLEEFQQSREIGRAIALRARLATAEHRYDDAIDAMRMNIRLGRDVANVPLLVCGLIGIAIEQIANGPLVEFIASPDSPNLYWALTELPEPLIDLRPAARFEMDFGPRLFPFMHNAETTEHAPQEWNRLYAQAIRDFGKLGGGWVVHGGTNDANDPQSKAMAGIGATGLALVGYSHAKEQLISQGMDRERIEQMAVGQVIAIYTERNYRLFADEWEKMFYLPFADIGQAENSVEKRLAAAGPFGGGKDREILPMVSLLFPAIQAARNAQVRQEREVASLRVIEALRMYAADHDRQLPKSLDEITAVPVPPNPTTGKPFAYRLENNTAILELPASDGIPGYNRRFEIQIAATVK